jgi:hypothetical protein
MQHPEHFLLVLVSLIAAIIWIISWFRSQSSRERRWMVLSLLAWVPLAFVLLWWWPWPLATIGLSPAYWSGIELVVALSLVWSLAADLPRNWLKLSYLQPVELIWWRYLLTLLILLLLSKAAIFLPWPAYLTLSIVLLAVSVIGFARGRSRFFKLQLLTASIVLIGSLIVGLAAGRLTPVLNIGIGINGWHLGWAWSQLLALVAAGLVLPVIHSWWFGQSIRPLPQHD